jgi:hypothetical protein
MKGNKLAFAIVETVFAIPILGAMIIMGLLWIPLGLALIGHIINLVFSIKAGGAKLGSIMGILASTVGLIPVVGWILHILTAIFLYNEAFKE